MVEYQFECPKANYQYLDSCSAPTCTTGAAVKADAYGLGMVPVSHALYDSGCRHFFVAQADEAVTLRQSFAETLSHICFRGATSS